MFHKTNEFFEELSSGSYSGVFNRQTTNITNRCVQWRGYSISMKKFIIISRRKWQRRRCKTKEEEEEEDIVDDDDDRSGDVEGREWNGAMILEKEHRSNQNEEAKPISKNILTTEHRTTNHWEFLLKYKRFVKPTCLSGNRQNSWHFDLEGSVDDSLSSRHAWKWDD